MADGPYLWPPAQATGSLTHAHSHTSNIVIRTGGFCVVHTSNIHAHTHTHATHRSGAGGAEQRGAAVESLGVIR